MCELWQSMTPLPGDLRLYGGTALALYLNHRTSTGFDFATPQPVVGYELIESIPWLKGASLVGGVGMLDAQLPTVGRVIKLTFMECGRQIPNPEQEPIRAANGVAVAAPEDLVIAKAAACLSRGETRDYCDLAAAGDAWPELTADALKRVPNREPLAVAMALSAPGTGVVRELSRQERQCLSGLAQDLVYGQHKNGWRR